LKKYHHGIVPQSFVRVMRRMVPVTIPTTQRLCYHLHQWYTKSYQPIKHPLICWKVNGHLQ